MIDEDRIMHHLHFLLETSEEGAVLHHLHVLGAPVHAVGPLGMPDPEQVHSTVFAIAPDDPATSGQSVEEYIGKTIMAAAVAEAKAERVVLFAGLSQEVWALATDRPDELGRRLAREGRLSEHPAAAEMTAVYGVCRDGRRWTGRRWLTGPKAGQTEDMELVVGRPHPREGGPQGRLVRMLAGVDG